MICVIRSQHYLLLPVKLLNEDPENLKPQQVKQLSQIIHRTSKKLLDQLNEVVDWAKKQSAKKTNFNPRKIRLFDGVLTITFDLFTSKCLSKRNPITKQNTKRYLCKGRFVNAAVYRAKPGYQRH